MIVSKRSQSYDIKRTKSEARKKKSVGKFVFDLRCTKKRLQSQQSNRRGLLYSLLEPKLRLHLGPKDILYSDYEILLFISASFSLCLNSNIFSFNLKNEQSCHGAYITVKYSAWNLYKNKAVLYVEF